MEIYSLKLKKHCTLRGVLRVESVKSEEYVKQITACLRGRLEFTTKTRLGIIKEAIALPWAWAI